MINNNCPCWTASTQCCYDTTGCLALTNTSLYDNVKVIRIHDSPVWDVVRETGIQLALSGDEASIFRRNMSGIWLDMRSFLSGIYVERGVDISHRRCYCWADTSS